MSEEIKFEKAMDHLAKIVEDLESGEVSLEDALKKYEEGIRLARTCQDQLARAEKKIEVLTKTLEGNFKKEPLEPEQESEPKTVSKKKSVPRSAKDSGSRQNGDLLY